MKAGCKGSPLPLGHIKGEMPQWEETYAITASKRVLHESLGREQRYIKPLSPSGHHLPSTGMMVAAGRKPMKYTYVGTVSGFLMDLRKRALGDMIDNTEVSSLNVYNKLHGGTALSVSDGTYKEQDDITLIDRYKEDFDRYADHDCKAGCPCGMGNDDEVVANSETTEELMYEQELTAVLEDK